MRPYIECLGKNLFFLTGCGSIACAIALTLIEYERLPGVPKTDPLLALAFGIVFAALGSTVAVWSARNTIGAYRKARRHLGYYAVDHFRHGMAIKPGDGIHCHSIGILTAVAEYERRHR